MSDSVKYMISLFLSILLFDFLFYKLNFRFGLLLSLRNMCFKDNDIESIKQDNK